MTMSMTMNANDDVIDNKMVDIVKLNVVCVDRNVIEIFNDIVIFVESDQRFCFVKIGVNTAEDWIVQISGESDTSSEECPGQSQEVGGVSHPKRAFVRSSEPVIFKIVA